MLTSTAPLRVLLSCEEKTRLELLAPFFGLSFQRADDVVILSWTASDKSEVVLFLDKAIAHNRLLAEMCSRAVPWVYFHQGEPATVTFFSHTDSRIKRIAELYLSSAEGEPDALSM